MQRLILMFLLVATVAPGLEAGSSSRKLLLDVQTIPLAWGDSRLAEKMETALSRNPELQIITHAPEDFSRVNSLPSVPDNRTDVEGLLEWGAEIGGRYLLVVTVEKESLERRKSFSLPLFFHKYETFAVIAGEYRFLDLQKRRLLAAEPFKTELSGARQFQAEMDDNSSDPTLHVSATAKSRLFAALEDKLTEKLVEQVARLTKGR